MAKITGKQLQIKYILRAVHSHLTRRHIPMDSPRKWHCFAYILSGTCIITLDNGKQFHAKDGDVLFLTKGQDYSMDVISEDYHYIVCDFLFQSDAQWESMHICPQNPRAFETLFQKLASTFAVPSPCSTLEYTALLYQIYALIIRNENTPYKPGSSKARIENARIWILSHLTDPDLNISTLAAKANMSECYFRELFKELYGVSPAKYIIHEKVALSKKLIALPELQLEDIALQSGFSSVPYFCTIFKNCTGTTPSAYRKKLQNL